MRTNEFKQRVDLSELAKEPQLVNEPELANDPEPVNELELQTELANELELANDPEPVNELELQTELANELELKSFTSSCSLTNSNSLESSDCNKILRVVKNSLLFMQKSPLFLKGVHSMKISDTHLEPGVNSILNG